jgi:hypothetical protein
MKVRKYAWMPAGAVGCRLRGLFVTLLAVLALLVHHEIAYALDASPAAMPGHSIHTATTPVAHAQTDSSGRDRLTAEADVAACPSMVMQHCSAAGVSSPQLAAPARSPAPASGADHSSITRADLVRSVGRAPPDLSVLSQLRI